MAQEIKATLEDKKEMARAIVRFRTNIGIKRGRLATMAGLTNETIAQLERLESFPRLSTMRKLQKAGVIISERLLTIAIGRQAEIDKNKEKLQEDKKETEFSKEFRELLTSCSSLTPAFANLSSSRIRSRYGHDFVIKNKG